LYINVDHWIAQQVTARTLEVLAQGNKRLRFSDQDALNIVLGGHIRYLDGKFNTIYDLVRDMERDVRTMHAPGKAVLLHFAGAIKPWADWNRHEARALFCRYHAMSPWSDMPLDAAPRNPREMRLQSRFLKNRGEFRSALVWYGRYLKARLGQSLHQ
jgi:UDP-glucose:(glucosyl)LPS alpha-1,3-glucosyltransferase